MTKLKTVCTVVGSAVVGAVLTYIGLKKEEPIKTFTVESYGKTKNCVKKLINAGKKGVTASKEAFKSGTPNTTIQTTTPAE